MTWLAVFYLPFLFLFMVVARTRGGFIAQDSLLVLFNAVALFGTLTLVDVQLRADVKYCWLVFSLTTLLTILVTALRLSFPLKNRVRLQVSSTPLTGRLVTLYLFSVVVCLGYYVAVGHITLLSALTSGGSYDAASARLDSYSGSAYFFPGYVNQFKNAVLPLLTVAIIHSLWSKKVAFRAPATVALALFGIVMVAGTGQRAPLVIVILVATSTLYLGNMLSGRRLIAAGLAFFALFAVQTTVLQRQATQLTEAQGALGQAKVFADALWSRVVLENPQSGLYAFHYTETLPFAWGREWVLDMIGVLPGVKGSDLANRVFEMVYGTPRGTAPASLWGQMYYNFDIAGSILVTALLAFIYSRTARWVLTRLQLMQRISLLRLGASSGMAISAGAWIAGSPLTVLNQCFFAYLALFVMEPRITGTFSRKQGPRSVKRDARRAAAYEPQPVSK